MARLPAGTAWRGRSGFVAAQKPHEFVSAELLEIRTQAAPNAGGGNGTSGNSGLIICHSAMPKPGGPYPNEGHEIQVCNLGNGSFNLTTALAALPGGSSSSGGGDVVPEPGSMLLMGSACVALGVIARRRAKR